MTGRSLVWGVVLLGLSAGVAAPAAAPALPEEVGAEAVSHLVRTQRSKGRTPVILVDGFPAAARAEVTRAAERAHVHAGASADLIECDAAKRSCRLTRGDLSVRFLEARPIEGAWHVRVMLSRPIDVGDGETRMFGELREIVATRQGGRWRITGDSVVLRT